MNEFEKDIHDKGNDFVHAASGFTFSFAFFFIIFIIGIVIKQLMT